jgi:hypothetical protein
MLKFHEIWIEQCEAARDAREAFGLEKAIGYLIGEKLLDFLRAADQDPAFAGELPRFVEEIKRSLDRAELQTYLDGVQRVGPLGHVCGDEVYDEMREAGAIPEDPACWAGEILTHRAREGAPARLNFHVLARRRPPGRASRTQ